MSRRPPSAHGPRTCSFNRTRHKSTPVHLFEDDWPRSLRRPGRHRNPRGEGLPIGNPRELLALDPAAFAELLETARPPAVSAQARMIVVASLPAEGEIVALDASSRQKLAALSSVLRAVRREGVYDITVIDVPQARSASTPGPSS